MASEKTPLLDAGLAEKGSKTGLVNFTTSRKKQAGFNFLFLKRLCLILRVAVPRLCSKSLLLLLGLILTRSAEEYNYYQIGVLPSDFYLSLTSKNLDLFKETLWKMGVIITAVCICKSGGELMAGLVYVHWRAVITRHLHSHYFSGTTYYILNSSEKRVDNPDQRISQDVDRFCNHISQVLPKIILQPFLIVYYSYRTFVGLGWYGVLGVYAFFALSTIINKFIMSPIVRVIFQQEKREGDFRFHHSQVRANSESIAFYRGGKNEGQKANQLLQALLSTQLKSVHWQFPLNYSVFFFDYGTTVLSYSLIGLTVFTGKFDHMSASDLASAISKNSFFSLYLLNGFTNIVDTAVSFAEVAGFTHRIGELLEVLKCIEREENEKEHNTESSSQHTSINSHRGELVAPGSYGGQVPPSCLNTAAVFTSLTISPPHSTRALVQDLSFNFCKGHNVLILGETGVGKTAILRVLRGLWSPVSGVARLCCDGGHHYTMFLSQKTYLTTGSLASQITYPESPKATRCVESRVNEALLTAGLASLRERLGGEKVSITDNWYDMVSPGEAQRIAFARLFYHKPPFAFLDEATSALSEDTESAFYTALQEYGVTVMSVGHRSTLQKFHQQVLRIASGGSWTLTQVT